MHNTILFVLIAINCDKYSNVLQYGSTLFIFQNTLLPEF